MRARNYRHKRTPKTIKRPHADVKRNEIDQQTIENALLVPLSEWSEASIAHLMHDVAHETLTPFEARIIHVAYPVEDQL